MQLKRTSTYATPGGAAKKFKHNPRKPSLATVVKRIIHNSEEKKISDVGQTATDMSSTGYVVFPLTSSIAEGTDITQRIGRKIQLIYNEVHFAVDFSSGAFGTLHLVLDRQPNGSDPAFTDIFTIGTAASPALAHKNKLTNDKRFKILWSHSFPDETTANTGNSLSHYSRFFKLENLGSKDSITEWGSSSATTPITNALYLVYGGGYSADTSGIAFQNRLCYVDM